MKQIWYYCSGFFVMKNFVWSLRALKYCIMQFACKFSHPFISSSNLKTFPSSHLSEKSAIKSTALESSLHKYYSKPFININIITQNWPLYIPIKVRWYLNMFGFIRLKDIEIQFHINFVCYPNYISHWIISKKENLLIDVIHISYSWNNCLTEEAKKRVEKYKKFVEVKRY